MKKKIFILSVSLFLGVFAANAQTMTEVRQMRYDAIDVFDRYSSLILNLDNPTIYTKDYFMELFEENSMLYNDILPYNVRQELSPNDYYDKYVNNIKTYPQLANLELSFPEYKDEKWQVKIKFTKTFRLKYRDIDLTYPQWSFNYEMLVVMDKNNDYIRKEKESYSKWEIQQERNKNFINQKIRSLIVEDPLTDYVVIVNQNSYNLEYDGNTIENWDENTHSRIFPCSDIDFKKITIVDSYFKPLKFSKNPNDKHVYNCSQRKLNIFGVGINYAPYGLGNRISKSNIDYFDFSDIEESNNTYSLSLFYGIQIANKQKSTWFFNIGLDFSLYNYNYKGNYYIPYQSIDSDNDPYLRKINIINLQENAHNFAVSIPLSFQYLFQISKSGKQQVFLAVELGGYAEYFVYQWNSFNFHADYTGLYNYYGSVEFDHYYDYGHFDLSDKDISQKLKDKSNQFDYGAFGKVGLWFALKKNNLLKFDIGYKHGFCTPLKYNENFVISENYNSYQTLLQSTNKGLQNIYIGLSFVWAIRETTSKISCEIKNPSTEK
jgi:hypothetical protein